jgi:hypothetical protein
VSDQPTTRTSTIRAAGFGTAAGLGVGLVYGFLTDRVGLTLGLLVVGVVGGAIIGRAVSWGAWSGLSHGADRRVALTAALGALGAWIVGLVAAYALSQIFFPQAATSLLARLSPSGFADYVTGTDDLVKLIQLLSLALMAFFAARGAR